MKGFFNKSKNVARAMMTAIVMILAAMTLQSCHILDDPEGDCSVRYNVAMRFTKNIMEANAFSSKVKSVTLLVYDIDGRLVTSKTESGNALQSDNYKMNIDVQPGTYHLLAWGGLEESNSFELNGGDAPLTLEEATVMMNREHKDGNAISAKPLTPLFHALEMDVDFPDNSSIYGDVTVATMDLTKDTNTIRLILTHYNAGEIDPNDFTFTIEDNNGRIGHDNSLLDDEMITYREWTKKGSANVGEFVVGDSRSEINSVHSVIAEIDIARLLTDHDPRLIITASGNEKPVLSLPITQLLLYAKGEARSEMSDQEYLDRQDEYTIQFFLNNDNGWYMNAGIYINGWHMRYQETDM